MSNCVAASCLKCLCFLMEGTYIVKELEVLNKSEPSQVNSRIKPTITIRTLAWNRSHCGAKDTTPSRI